MTEQRLRSVFEDLERMLLDFIKAHRITHDEYRRAIELIIETILAGERSLMFDVFLEAEATDAGAVERTATAEAVQGPFYVPGAPQLSPPYVLPGCPPGQDPLLFRGRVTSPDGEPLPGVEIDMWQSDGAGRYSSFCPDIPEWALRGRFSTAPDGTFEVTTVMPVPYEIPGDGPTGRLLRALGRHLYRPAHIHMKLSCTGFQPITTQLYFAGSPYLDSDVANAVRESLVMPVMRRENITARSQSLQTPYFEARYDFVLQPTPVDACDPEPAHVTASR